VPLSHYVTEAEKKWLFKVAEDYTPWADRDVCLLTFFLGTPCTILELNRIQIRDVLTKGGKVAKKFQLEKDDYKGDPRYCYLKNSKIKAAIERYLEALEKEPFSKGETKQYRGFDPDANFFITQEGTAFSLTKSNGKFKPDSLKRHIFNMMKEAGIENPGMDSGRRTFAVNLHRAGIDMSHIHHLLGNKAKKTTQRQLTSDPINMADIAARAF